MSTISYSARHFSDDDEKRELDELTDAEKEAILDDKYGRKNTARIGSDSSQSAEISDDLMARFYRALEELPPDVSGIFWRACVEADDIVDSESNPMLFLRREDYDPQKAVLRLCEYWNNRYEIFGEDRAFKPMTLDGAMIDVLPFMLEIPNFFHFLPNDDHGRTVICWDRSGMQFKDYDDIVLSKIIWYVAQLAIGKRSTQENGVVMIGVNPSSGWDFPSTSFIKQQSKLVKYGLPLKVSCRHFCISSLALTYIMPMFKYFIGREGRRRLQIHNIVMKSTMLNDLESFGIRAENLPKSIGGTFDEEPSWITECKHILAEQKIKNRRKKRQRRGSRN